MANKVIVNGAKVFWKSKTFWASVISFVVGFLQLLQGELAVGGSLTIMSVIMLVLRIVTKDSISL